MRFYDRLLHLCGLLAGLTFAVIAAATAYDVFLRNVMGDGVRGLIDLIEYGLFVTTFLAAPWVLRQGGHVQVDFAIELLPPRPRVWLQRFGDLIGLAVSLLLLVYSTRVTLSAYEQGSLVLKAVIFPEWWVFAVMPPSSALLCIEFLRRLLQREHRAATADL